MSEDTLRTVCWCVVVLFAIQGITIYSVVRLLATGRPLFERKTEHEAEPGRVVGTIGAR